MTRVPVDSTNPRNPHPRTTCFINLHFTPVATPIECTPAPASEYRSVGISAESISKKEIIK